MTEQKFDFKKKGDEEELGRISKDDELIRKSAQGTFVMYKSCFDFIEKPLPSVKTATSTGSRSRSRRRRKARWLVPSCSRNSHKNKYDLFLLSFNL